MSTRKSRRDRGSASQQPNPAETAATAPHEKQDRTASPSHKSTLPSDEKHHPEPAKRDSMAQKGDKHWLEYATGLFAFIAASGAILAAIFGGWQASVSSDTERRQLRAYVSGFPNWVYAFDTKTPVQLSFLMFN